jgi:hypothetical protein
MSCHNSHVTARKSIEYHHHIHGYDHVWQCGGTRSDPGSPCPHWQVMPTFTHALELQFGSTLACARGRGFGSIRAVLYSVLKLHFLAPAWNSLEGLKIGCGSNNIEQTNSNGVGNAQLFSRDHVTGEGQIDNTCQQVQHEKEIQPMSGFIEFCPWLHWVSPNTFEVPGQCGKLPPTIIKYISWGFWYGTQSPHNRGWSGKNSNQLPLRRGGNQPTLRMRTKLAQRAEVGAVGGRGLGGHHLPALIYGLFYRNKKYFPPWGNPVGST